MPSKPKGVSTLQQVVDFYMRGPRFLALKGKTQLNYEMHLTKACQTRLSDGRLLGNVRARSIHVKHMVDCYEQWLQIGTSTANKRMAILSACWKYARQWEIVTADPISLVDRVPTKPRRVKWSRDNVKTFLSTAYSSFEYRSIGLLVHMAYEWGQRVGDMRTLTWGALDLEAQRIDLTQSKRNADVHLPISDNLTKMLLQQKEDFGFQQYVVPHTKPRAGAYTPYKEEEICIYINRVKQEANLPHELTAMDLRRTAVTEMLEGGVDMAGIMQVTGHRNPQSVKPYMVNTYRGASAALAARGGQQDE
ncbi:MAG: phage integrase family protein [Gammaproteobacteria bacterium]|nr:phage integrase family protein [Gammaproteobacteria bacterium]